jgi:hypothetical protein
LFEVIMLAAGEMEYDPITSTFLGYKNAIYCPELYRVAVTHEGGKPRPHEVVVIFDKLTAPSVVGDEVFNLIRANFRFRDEVFDRFADLQKMVDEDDVDVVFDRLRESLGVIAHEAETHGFFDQATLRVAYGNDYNDELEHLQDRWIGARKRLTKHIDNRQVDATQDCLEQLARINLAFSIHAADRHLKLLNQRAEPLGPSSADTVVDFRRAGETRD